MAEWNEDEKRFETASKLPKRPSGPLGLPPHKPWYEANYSQHVKAGSRLGDLNRFQQYEEFYQRAVAAGMVETGDGGFELTKQARPQVDALGNRFGGQRVPADGRRGAARWRVGEWETRRYPRVLRSAGRVLQGIARSAGAIGLIIAPSELGDGTAPVIIEPNFDPDFGVEDAEELGLGYFKPEFGPKVQDWVYQPRILDRSPKRGDIIIRPSSVPDEYVPQPLPIELPQVDVDTIPVAPPGVASPKYQERPGPPVLAAPEWELNVEFDHDGDVRIRQRTRYNPRRFTRRKRDAKTNAIWQWSQVVLNGTIGTVDEIRQFMDAVAWNSYAVVKGERVPAMVVADGSALRVAQGVAQGDFELDLAGAITDYAMSQAMDHLVGRASRVGQRGLNDAGWHSPLGWQVGPADTGGHYLGMFS